MSKIKIPNRDEIIELIKTNALSEKEEIELLQLLELEMRDQAIKDYELFAEEYIKITDKIGDQVSLSHNKIQKKINDKVKELKEQGNPVRIIILKARQHGASTNEQGRMLYNTSTKKNRNGLIVAQDEDTSKVIFNKARYMYDNLPSHVKPLQKASNARELIFDRPTGYRGTEQGLNSGIRIQVAGKVSIGRGNTIHYAHLSEVAFWPSPEGMEVKKQISGILQSVPKSVDTEVVIESTANGYNDFKELWDEAVAGQNEWVPLFFPWHDNEEYAMQCTEEGYNSLINNLDNRTYEYLFGINKQPGIVQMYNLTKEQIFWYIWTLRNDCNGDHNIMKQENPSFPEESFLATGTPVFDNEKVQSRIEYLRQKYRKKAPKKGRFAFEWGDAETKDYIKPESIRWVDDGNGFITIYEDVKQGYPYVIGGDTKGEGRDFYSGTVINNVTGNRVATIRNQWTNSKPYTWQMYCLGYYYNLALIGIEVNFNTAPIEELERLHYPRQYTRRRYDHIAKELQQKRGWKTDGNTRPLIIDKAIHLIEHNIDLFNDITMLDECMTFIYKDGRPDAMSGKHDDALFSDMIANEIRQQQTFEVEVEVEPLKYSFGHDTEYEWEQSRYSESPFE